MNNLLYLNVLPKEQVELFNFLSTQPWLDTFYLAGGTALALQIGHRESVDFDFFTVEDFNTSEIKQIISALGKYEPLTEGNNTLYALLNDVRISFFKYKYPLVRPVQKNNCFTIAHTFDVALMKLEAIAGRGAKKDFIDLFFLLKQYNLKDLLDSYTLKYGVSAYNYHLLKSLVFFEDADKERMPTMFENISWEQVKQGILNEAKSIKF